MIPIKTIVLIILGLYLLASVYFGIIKKLKIFKALKKFIKLIIFIIIVGIALYLLYAYKAF